MLHRAPLTRVWEQINRTDWKLVENIKDSPVSVPLRTLAWVYSFEGEKWNIQTPRMFMDNSFDSPDDAMRYVEVVFKMEDSG